MYYSTSKNTEWLNQWLIETTFVVSGWAVLIVVYVNSFEIPDKRKESYLTFDPPRR